MVHLQGPSDPAILSNLMSGESQVMSSMFNMLYGDVIKVLTDAGSLVSDMTMTRITAILPLHGESQASQVHRALLAMEQALETVRARVPTGYPDVSWHASGGVGIGSVVFAVISDEQLHRKVLLVDGPALDQANEAVGLAKNEQIIAHREVMKRLGSTPGGQWIGNHRFFLPSDSFARTMVGAVLSIRGSEAKLAHLESLQPPQLSGRQDQRLMAFMDPLLRLAAPFVSLQRGLYTKRVVSLCLRIQDMTLFKEEALARWQRVLEVVLSTAERYQGLLDRVAIDNGEGEIRLIFGMPHVQEKPSYQAALCALALQRGLTPVEPSVRISLAGGRGFASLMGTSVFSKYTVISPALQKALKFVGFAGVHEILADPYIQDATQSSFAWRKLELYDESAGPIFALAGEIVLGSGLRPRHKITGKTQLIGREKEQTELQQIVKDGLAGKAHLLLVRGEAGHGRSALIDEVIGQWLEAGGNGFLSIGPPYTPAPPYSLWTPIWQALFELRMDDEPAANLQKLSLALSRLLPDVDWGAALYATLLGLSSEGDPLVRELAPMARQQRVFETTLAILKQLATVSPILLVFEYLDYADSVSLELLLQLVEKLTDVPILICIEDRGTHNYSFSGLFLHARKVTASALTSSEAWQLFNQLVPEVEWPANFRGALTEWLGPEKPEETQERSYKPVDVVWLATVLENVILKRRGDQWDFKNSLPPERWPTDTIEIIDLLLDEALDEEESQLITHAAPAGMVFYHDAPWLKEISSSSVIELSRVRQMNLCEPHIDEGISRRWDRFRHRSLREALYMHLSLTDRAKLHVMVADWISKHTPGVAGMAMVGIHADYAGNVQRAVEAYLASSEHAADWGAYAEAMQSLLAAERLLTRHEKQSDRDKYLLEISLKRATLNLQHERIDKGLHDVNRAIELAEQLADNNKLSDCLILRARLAQLKRNFSQVEEDVKRASALAEETGDEEILAQALWLQSRVLYTVKRHRQAIQMLGEAIRKANGDNPALQIEIGLDAGRILLEDYHRDQANQHVMSAFKRARKLSDPVMLHQVYAQVGNVHLLYGRAEEALNALEEAIGLPPPSDANVGNLGGLLVNLGTAQCYVGRYTDAEATFDTAYDYFMADGDEIGMLEVNIVRASELYLDCKKLEKAQEALDEANINSERLSTGMRLLMALTQTAIFTRQGSYDSSRLILEKFEETPKSYARLWYGPLYRLRQAELAMAEGKPEAAQTYAYESLGMVGFQGDLRYLTAAYTLLAETLILREERPEAISDALERAISTGRKSGRRLHLAHAMLLMGYYLQNVSHQFRTRARASAFRFESDQIYRELNLPMPDTVAGIAIAQAE